MKLAIGFITYNESSAPYLPYFLESLGTALDLAKLSDSLILAFDNSDSHSLINGEIISQFLSKRRDLRIEQLRAGKNIGFARAYNLMIKEALAQGAEYFLVINPDIILNKDSLQLLMKEIGQRSDLAAVAPRIMSWDFKNLAKTNIIDSLGIAQGSALNFFDLGQGEILSAPDEDIYRKKAGEMIAPSGAAGLYHLSALTAVAEDRGGVLNYFDERFFMYKEDCDLAYRFFIKGFKAKTIFDALMYHDRTTKSLGGGLKSFFRARHEKSRQARAWSFRNQHYIYLKYFSAQNVLTKIRLSVRIIFLLIFSLIFEQFLLKEYPKIIRFARGKV